MRSLVFTIMFLGGACIIMGYGLMDMTRTRVRGGPVGVQSPSEARLLDVRTQILPDLRAEETARMSPLELVKALDKLYADDPRTALVRLMEMPHDEAVATLVGIHARELSPDRRRAVLSALAANPQPSARAHLMKVAEWPSGPDRDWARRLLRRRRVPRSAHAPR